MPNLVFNILMALITVFAGAIANELMPYLRARKEEATAKIRQTQWAWAADIIDAVVRAVEQTVSEGIHGEGKKQLAVNYINQLFEQAGLSLPPQQVDALIEAAVQSMNTGKAAIPAPVVVSEGVLECS